MGYRGWCQSIFNLWTRVVRVINKSNVDKPNNTNTMNKEIMKMIIVHKISKKIDEVIEQMSTNEFKEMVLDDYFDFTKDSLDDVDLEVNEIISEISKTIRLSDYRTK
jgi:hypothetical protein